jgi:hypothetical protein
MVSATCGMPVQAEARGELALVHHAFAAQVRIFEVVHDQRAEIARIDQRPAHHLGVHHRARPIGEEHRAGFHQQAELGHLSAMKALGQRRRGPHIDDSLVARPPLDEVDDRRVVHHGSVSGRHTSVVTPPAAAASDAVRKVSRCSAPGSPAKAHQVDQTGGKDEAAAIVDFGIGGQGAGLDRRAKRNDHAIADQHAAMGLCAGGRVDEAGVGEGEGHWLDRHFRRTDR